MLSVLKVNYWIFSAIGGREFWKYWKQSDLTIDSTASVSVLGTTKWLSLAKYYAYNWIF